MNLFINDIVNLVRQGESNVLEFKKTTGQLERAMESVCGFLNAQGGKVLIGVNDNGKITGQEVYNTPQNLDHWLS
jgi:ATP-dependent DNA helicase RecG